MTVMNFDHDMHIMIIFAAIVHLNATAATAVATATRCFLSLACSSLAAFIRIVMEFFFF